MFCRSVAAFSIVTFAPQALADVSCGGNSAATCADCSKGITASEGVIATCNGDCKAVGSECLPASEAPPLTTPPLFDASTGVTTVYGANTTWIITTTSSWTAWDSSSGISGNSLASSLSSSGFLNDGSSVSDSSMPGQSSGDSSGSNASGSGGSFLQLWHWFALAGVGFCCVSAAGAAAASMGGKKKMKRSGKRSAPLERPIEPAVEVEPLPEAAVQQPLVQPGWGMPTAGPYDFAPAYGMQMQPMMQYDMPVSYPYTVTPAYNV
jgi:hypothetical protein